MTITQPTRKGAPNEESKQEKKCQEKGQVRGMINVPWISGMNGYREQTFGTRKGIGKGYQ